MWGARLKRAPHHLQRMATDQIMSDLTKQQEASAPPAYDAPITVQPGFTQAAQPGGYAPPVQPGPYPHPAQPSNFHSSSSNTTVVLNAPQPAVQPVNKKRTWTTDIFGCFSDMTNCAAVTLCPNLYLYYLSMKLGENLLLPCAFGCSYQVLVPLRVKVRAENNIMGNICEDCCMVCWCPCCVMCQLQREHEFLMKNNNNKVM
ncbi:placenta-specific gene 8 protein-like [Saccostrea echinata]|uniref:placenta-specific gene 8 protein-like n=1 Tax=Saccostrea echinata TaxID=191078 RepID=UPI002A816579|nr:placenta-specific gene 8 protein-like [Saccostrea echinata]